MKIGKTEFGEHIQRWSFKHFQEVFSHNEAMQRDISRYGHTLESAFELLTGKKVPKKYVQQDDTEGAADQD